MSIDDCASTYRSLISKKSESDPINDPINDPITIKPNEREQRILDLLKTDSGLTSCNQIRFSTGIANRNT